MVLNPCGIITGSSMIARAAGKIALITIGLAIILTLFVTLVLVYAMERGTRAYKISRGLGAYRMDAEWLRKL
jgi:amino acid transporter